MRIVALLSWYEESPAWLAECVTSAAKLCDHIIAVDGPYAHFPGAHKKPFSSPEQADVIEHTAAGLGIGSTIHSPREPWWSGEVGKRDFMFKLGMTFAEPNDWFLRIDADEVLTHVPSNAKQRLADSEHDVAEVSIWEREASNPTPVSTGDYQSPFRCLFRAIPGIRIEQAHFVVTAPVDGQRVFLAGPHPAPAEDLWDVKLEHRTRMRTTERKQLKDEYSLWINELEKVGETPDE